MHLYITNVSRRKIFQHARDQPAVLQGKGIDGRNRLLIIAGLHRSGTSLLQNLLCLDPRSRTTRTWEMMQTIPPSKNVEETMNGSRAHKLDASFDKIDLFCRKWRENFHKVHYFTAQGPEEDVIVLFDMFVIWYYSYFLHDLAPELNGMLMERKDVICRFLHLYLKVMESGYKPESHWVLKNPDSCHYLPELLDEFPEANVIVSHRHPNSVVPSWANMMLQCLHVRLYNDFSKWFPQCDVMKPANWGRACMAQSSAEAKHLLQARDEIRASSPEKEERILDISYSALTSDPIQVVREIYEHFGYEFTDEYHSLLRDYMAANPKGKHGKVSYSLDDYNLSQDIIAEEFSAYIAKYSKFF